MSERRTAEEWREKCKRGGPKAYSIGYEEAIVFDLAAVEAERDGAIHAGELESDAAVECLARAEKAEAERDAMKREWNAIIDERDGARAEVTALREGLAGAKRIIGCMNSIEARRGGKV